MLYVQQGSTDKNTTVVSVCEYMTCVGTPDIVYILGLVPNKITVFFFFLLHDNRQKYSNQCQTPRLGQRFKFCFFKKKFFFVVVAEYCLTLKYQRREIFVKWVIHKYTFFMIHHVSRLNITHPIWMTIRYPNE